MTKIPGDSHIRAKLDPIEPSQFHPMFDDILGELQRSDGIRAFRRLDDHVLIALDGTQYHSSYKVHCPAVRCSIRQHANGKTEYHHGMLAATLVAPGHNPRRATDPGIHRAAGWTRQAGLRKAAPYGAGWTSMARGMPRSTPSSWETICSPSADVRGGRGRRRGTSCLSGKPTSHPAIEDFRAGVVLDELKQKIKRGRQFFTYVTSG